MISDDLKEISRRINAIARIVDDDLAIDDVIALISDSDDLHDQQREFNKTIYALDHYINEKRLARGNSLGADE